MAHTRVCERCGGEISDLSRHPRAKQCPSCRSKARNAKVYENHYVYVPVVREYLDRHGWPTFIRGATAISEEPGLIDQLGATSPVEAKVRFSICVREVVGPHGEQYVLRSTKRGVLILVSPNNSTSQEATA